MENKQKEWPLLWYHGTNKLFDKFSLYNQGNNFGQSILGIYFSQYLKPPPFGSTAEEYAKEVVRNRGGKPYVYECELDYKNALILDSNGWPSSNNYIDSNRHDLIKQLKEYDSLIVYDFEEYELEYRDFICVIKNIEQIKILNIIEIKKEL